MGLSAAWEALKSAADGWISQPLAKPVIGFVKAEGASNSNVSGQEFVPESSYFSVRIVEMHLAEGGKYFASFLPLAVCLTEYTVGSARQRTPLILSNDVIAEQLKGAGVTPGLVEYRNMYVVRRAPVKSDNLSLFVGLFRMPYDDLAKQMLQIASDVTDQVVGGAPVSQGIRVAEKVYDRIAGLFSLNVMKPLLGYADGNALFKSGYLVVAGPGAEGLTTDKFSVVDEHLRIAGPQGSAAASGFDYCLLAIEYVDSLFPDGTNSINSVVDLAFHKRWRSIAQLLATKKVHEADAEMPVLRSEVVASSDLTEDDRLIAIAAYDVAYEKFREALVKPDLSLSTRGDNLATGLASAAYKRKETQVGIVLQEMADRLNSVATIPKLEEKNSDQVGDRLFSEEASSLRASLTLNVGAAPRSGALVEAISAAANRTPTVGED